MPHTAQPARAGRARTRSLRPSSSSARSAASAQAASTAARRAAVEGRSDEVFESRAALGPPHADADAPDLVRPERPEYRADAAVAAISRTRAHAHGADRNVEVVVDQDQVGRSEAEALRERCEAPARRVHPRRLA